MARLIRVAATLGCVTSLVLAPVASGALDCGSGSAAVNEYCETLPTPTGPQSTAGGFGRGGAGTGSAPLIDVLPHRITRSALRSRHTSVLLGLPAPDLRHLGRGTERNASVGSGGIVETIGAALVLAIAATGGVLVFVRRRRHTEV